MTCSCLQHAESPNNMKPWTDNKKARMVRASQPSCEIWNFCLQPQMDCLQRNNHTSRLGCLIKTSARSALEIWFTITGVQWSCALKKETPTASHGCDVLKWKAFLQIKMPFQSAVTSGHFATSKAMTLELFFAIQGIILSSTGTGGPEGLC